MGRYRCTVCNYIYNEEKEKTLFNNIPNTWHCPICGAPKTAFIPEGIQKEKSPVDTTVADKVIEQLESFGVRHIYGIPGDSNLPLIDAIRKNKKIKFVLTRHEETAAFMASAHGKMTDTLGVCISIAGPGSTNLITGLMDAATDRSPVLALAGQVPEVYLGSEAFQEIDQIDIFKPFSEYAETLARHNKTIRLINRAVKYAYRKPGVSVISTPTDILTEKLSQDITILEHELFDNKILSDEKIIKKGATVINQCKKVVILAGWGARHASNQLLELSKKLNAPIATTSRAKGTIHETYSLALGVLGSIGSKHAAQAVQNADCIFVIGSGFRQANLVPDKVKIIQIDIDPTRIGKTFDVSAGLLGDASLILQKLIHYVDSKPPQPDLLESIKKLKLEHKEEIEIEGKDYSIPINPGFVIQAIKRIISKNAIICVDVGDHTYWFYKKFICEGQKPYLSANMASMGFGLPAALSAKLDYPDRQVVCVTGDGGFGMLLADFTTAVREKLDITIIVFNDGRLKNIKKEQIRSNYPEFGVTFPNPNFAIFADSAGGKGFRITDPKELDNALKEAFQSKLPCIIEILVDPDKMAAGTKSAN
jgi:pyruvate oxidase